MSSEEGKMTASLGRRRRESSPMDVDDLLSEILLRLPPQPSSLPRASLVCSRWRRLVSDRGFLRRFRLHHRRRPPILGCFVKIIHEIYFEPTMESPDRVPRDRFSPQPLLGGDVFVLLGCRHGLVLIFYWRRLQLLVWDPVNGRQDWVALPPGFDMVEAPIHIQGAVLRAAADAQHFQVVLVGLEKDIKGKFARVVACVYSSETGGWADLISTQLPPVPYMHGVPTMVYMGKPSVLVGDSLHWLTAGTFVRNIEFDLERQSLAVTEAPVDMLHTFARRDYQFSFTRAEDGGLGFLNLLDCSAQLWKRKTNCNGIASWVLERTIELDKLLSNERAPLRILGFAEENNVVFLGTAICVFMIHLESLQWKNIYETNSYYPYHAFECVYTAGNNLHSEVITKPDKGIGDGHDGAELLHK